MAFGQAAGPPAPARQIDELAEMLARVGFASFREARHPYGLNQRQAAGRFTADEAAELIERLEAAEVVEQAGATPPEGLAGQPPAAESAPAPRSRGASSSSGSVPPKPRTLSQLDDAVLVAELERRGWCCIAPPNEPT